VPLADAAAAPLAEPAREGLVMEARQRAVALDAERLLEQGAAGPRGVGPVGQRRGGRAERSQRVRAAQPSVLPAHAFSRRPRRLGPQHQAREIDVEAVRRGVGAVVEAQLALPAEVDDAPVVGGGDLRDVPLRRVDPLEHEIEARAEAVAPAAPIADPGDARELLLDGRGVEEGGVGGIEGQPQSSLRLSSPFVNRPAWLRSALASVSNHSAISGNPSSRAVRAMPGYICVYS
jgi:hypothetical protein